MKIDSPPKRFLNLEALPTFTFILFHFIAYLEIVKIVLLHSSLSCNCTDHSLKYNCGKKEPIAQKVDWSEEAKRWKRFAHGCIIK